MCSKTGRLAGFLKEAAKSGYYYIVSLVLLAACIGDVTRIPNDQPLRQGKDADMRKASQLGQAGRMDG